MQIGRLCLSALCLLSPRSKEPGVKQANRIRANSPLSSSIKSTKFRDISVSVGSVLTHILAFGAVSCFVPKKRASKRVRKLTVHFCVFVFSAKSVGRWLQNHEQNTSLHLLGNFIAFAETPVVQEVHAVGMCNAEVKSESGNTTVRNERINWDAASSRSKVKAPSKPVHFQFGCSWGFCISRVKSFLGSTKG